MKIQLEKPAHDALARALAHYLKTEFDVEIGGMEAVMLLDFISERLGPHYYNQALHDGHAHLHARMEALGEALFDLQKPAKL